ADSATRTSLQASGVTGGWDGVFFLQSPDDRFRLEVGGLIQTRFTWGYIQDGQSGVTVSGSTIADNEENRSGFDLPSTRIDFRGHAFGAENQFRVQAEYSNSSEALVGQNPFGNLGSGSGTLRLLDAYTRHELGNDFAVRVGQFKLPFAREQLVGIADQLAISRSTVVEHMGLGRSQGIEAAWSYDDYRVMAAFSNGATDNVYGTLKGAGSDPLNSPWYNDAVDWALTGRVEWKLAGEWRQFNSMTSPPGDGMGILLGLAGHVQEGDPDLGNDGNSGEPNNWWAYTADFSVMYGGATVFASFTYSNMDSGSAYIQGGNNFNAPTTFDIGESDMWGAVVQGSFYAAPKWELFARYEYAQASIDGINQITAPTGAGSLWSDNPLSIATLGVNWYIDGEDLKWSSDVGFAFDAVDGIFYNGENGWRAAAEENQVVFRSQLQMRF
ncbi:MAG: porin, partial [Planctomycetota bacterium]